MDLKLPDPAIKSDRLESLRKRYEVDIIYLDSTPLYQGVRQSAPQ